MDCCEYECDQGRNCPVRRQRAYPATLPAELPVWPDTAKASTLRRIGRIAAALAGYVVLLMALMCAATAVAVWLSL